MITENLNCRTSWGSCLIGDVAHADPEFLLLGMPETLGTGRCHRDRYAITLNSTIASKGQTGVVLRVPLNKRILSTSQILLTVAKSWPRVTVCSRWRRQAFDSNDYIQRDRISKLGILDVYSFPFIIIWQIRRMSLYKMVAKRSRRGISSNHITLPHSPSQKPPNQDCLDSISNHEGWHYCQWRCFALHLFQECIALCRKWFLTTENEFAEFSVPLAKISHHIGLDKRTSWDRTLARKGVSSTHALYQRMDLVWIAHPNPTKSARYAEAQQIEIQRLFKMRCLLKAPGGTEIEFRIMHIAGEIPYPGFGCHRLPWSRCQLSHSPKYPPLHGWLTF